VYIVILLNEVAERDGEQEKMRKRAHKNLNYKHNFSNEKWFLSYSCGLVAWCAYLAKKMYTPQNEIKFSCKFLLGIEPMYGCDLLCQVTIIHWTNQVIRLNCIDSTELTIISSVII